MFAIVEHSLLPLVVAYRTMSVIIMCTDYDDDTNWAVSNASATNEILICSQNIKASHSSNLFAKQQSICQ